MLTNLQSQLADAGLADRFDDVVAECVLIRKELGWPIMVTPFAQFVVTQAVYNFMSGERYSVVPDVVKQYALGHFGKLLAPVEPDVLDRIVANGSQAITPEVAPLAPAVPALRRQYPDASDEERLLRFMFSPGDQVDRMLAAPPIDTDYVAGSDPVCSLVRDIAELKHLGRVDLRDRSVHVQVNAST
jgi:oxaloacetate decarboxylase alpha subunit